MMTPGSGILTSLMNTFAASFTQGVKGIGPSANRLLGMLLTLDLTWAALWWALGGDQDVIKSFLKKVFKYGLFIFLVTNYRFLLNSILDGFVWVGVTAGGNGVPASMIKDPSEVSEFGLAVAQPIFTHISNFSGLSVIPNLHAMALAGLAGLLIIFSYFAIGLQIFITYVEFYLCAVIALILLPFGVLEHTRFLAEKVIGAVISFGIKLAVITLLASAALPIVQQWELPPDPTFYQCLYVLLGSLAITLLCWHAPSVATSLLSGSPSLSASTGAAMAVGAATTLASAAPAASATAAATKEMVQKTAAAAGGLSAAVQTGGLSEAVNLAGIKTVETGKAAVNALTAGAPTAFEEGGREAIKTLNESGGGAGSGGSSSSGGASSKAGKAPAPDWAKTIQKGNKS